MSSIKSLLGWSLLLAFALLAPVSLPAGGGNQTQGKIRRSDETMPIFAGENCQLKTSPSVDAPSLRVIQAGTPIRVLRIWQGPDGNNWLQVKIVSLEINHIFISEFFQ